MWKLLSHDTRLFSVAVGCIGVFIILSWATLALFQVL